MTPRDPEFRTRVASIFHTANFINALGIELVDLGAGWCTAALAVEARHLQQHGYVHAGVVTTLADHAGGGAGATLIGVDDTVLTAEFKVNFLRPAGGARLRGHGQVLKAGRSLIVVESEVFAPADAGEVLVAKAMITLAVVPADRHR